jgi:hypothetical protein
MPRIARIVVPSHPYHVTQRGNDRQAVFRHDSDSKAHDDRATTGKGWGYPRGEQETGTSNTRVTAGKTKVGSQ